MLGLLPAILALLVVILASLLSTYMTARRNALSDVESQAMVVADNTGAGLAFGDRQVVDEIVGALDVRPNIDMVCVYDQAGGLFSRFQRAGFACPSSWPAETPMTVPGAQLFDVLICDLAMPGMDGFEVLRAIRSTPGLDGHESRAIALTALASDSDRQAVLDAGFDDHIVKPFSFPDLLRAVSRSRPKG